MRSYHQCLVLFARKEIVTLAAFSKSSSTPASSNSASATPWNEVNGEETILEPTGRPTTAELLTAKTSLKVVGVWENAKLVSHSRLELNLSKIAE